MCHAMEGHAPPAKPHTHQKTGVRQLKSFPQYISVRVFPRASEKFHYDKSIALRTLDLHQVSL